MKRDLDRPDQITVSGRTVKCDLCPHRLEFLCFPDQLPEGVRTKRAYMQQRAFELGWRVIEFGKVLGNYQRCPNCVRVDQKPGPPDVDMASPSRTERAKRRA